MAKSGKATSVFSLGNGLLSAMSLFAWLFCLLSVTSAGAPTTFGDITVTLEHEPRTASFHGYFEAWVRIDNKSDHAAHRVQLSIKMPIHEEPDTRAAARTITVEHGESVRVPITLPFPQPDYFGNTGIGVVMDGYEMKALAFSQSYGGPSGTPIPLGLPLILCSESIDIPPWASRIVYPGLPTFDQHSQPVAAWTPNWLGYSRYDGIVLTAEDLLAMPADVREAIGRYVECGGSLLVLGEEAKLPGYWKPQRIGNTDLWGCPAGFGECFVCDQKILSVWESDSWKIVLDSWTRTVQPWAYFRYGGDANQKFPVVDDIGTPPNGFFVLMAIFTITIGPFNFYFLTRRRKLWLFLTVPMISLATCLIIIGYVLFSEGRSGRSREEGFTILDENTLRASTIGCIAIYTQFLPGDGLHFSTQTEIAFQNGYYCDPGNATSFNRYESHRLAGSLDWTHDQNLISGWVWPRIPAHFILRKSETRGERITFTQGEDGRPEAMNGLGADIVELWYADEKGTIFHAVNVPAGARAALDEARLPPVDKIWTLREIYGTDPMRIVDEMKRIGRAILTPKTYLAVMNAAPFLDDEIVKGTTRKARSVVLGIIKEGD